MQHKQEKEIELWGKFCKKEKEMKFCRQEVTFTELPDIPEIKQPNIYGKSPKWLNLFQILK